MSDFETGGGAHLGDAAAHLARADDADLANFKTHDPFPEAPATGGDHRA